MTQVKLDDYILDTLLRDLTGHDRRPAAYLTYLWLAGEQARRKSPVSISYQELAENTGLSRSSVQASVFDMSHIYASGNLAGDMYANVAAETTGRTLAVRLYNATDDAGMKDMLSFNIARDTMHQEQWLAVLEELGPSHLPVPNSFPQSKEKEDFSYKFFITTLDKEPGTQAGQPWTSGLAPDGVGEFEAMIAKPLGEEPNLGFGRPDTFGQKEQAIGSPAGVLEKGKDIVTRTLHKKKK